MAEEKMEDCFYTTVLELCERCKSLKVSFDEEPCKSCAVRPSNFEEKTDED